ncbi:MAG: bile acid:sodium symporter family protein [Allosphingosinicella sp.]
MDLSTILSALVQISTMLIIFSIGLQSRWSDLLHAVARPRLLFGGFIAVYVAVPLAAFACVMLLPIEPAVKIGIVAMALSPLAPVVPGKMLDCGAESSYVVGMYVALLILAVPVVPATLALVTTVSGGTASIHPWTVAFLVVTSILLPLLAGIFLGGVVPAAAGRIAPIVRAGAFGTVAILVALLLIAAHRQLLDCVGNGTLLAIVVAELAGLVCGHLIGGPDPGERMALGQAAASRHPGLAVLIIKQSFEIDPPMLAAVLLYLVVGVVISALYLRWARGRLAGSGPAVSDRQVKSR